MSNSRYTRVPNKKPSFGYQTTATPGTSSSSSYRMDKGKEGAANISNQNTATPGTSSSSYRLDKGKEGATNMSNQITMIQDVDPMLDNITIQGRCISMWHSHRLNEAHNPYSLDLVLQDSQNGRIQIYIKKEWMFRFEPLFKEGQCYAISNFAIAENSGKLPLLPHSYKISFYKGTIVQRIDTFVENPHGFILEPFNRLLDGTRRYHEHEAVDVIGSVVAIGDVVPVQSAAGRKIRRTVVIEDSESNKLDCTFWDHWASMWDEYAHKRNELGHVVFILQLGKVKYWDGTPSIHNALFGTKMFINRELPEIQSFRQRFKELPEYDENQYKISVFTPQKPVVTISEFFHGAVKKMVASIRECEQKTHCIVFARIHKIHKENGWAYTACKQCNKKVTVFEGKSLSSSAKNKVTFWCEDHGSVQVASRYKVIMRIIDQSGSAPIVFFNTTVNKLSGHIAWELMERHGMDVDDYWPSELLELVGKRVLFKLYFSDYNVSNNNHTYRCDAVNDEREFIEHFKDGFLEDEDMDEEFSTPADKIKHNNFTEIATPYSDGGASGSGSVSGTINKSLNDSILNRVLMSTPSSEIEGSGSASKRVFIDLEDIESADEDECGTSGTFPRVVRVKIEKED